MSFTEDFADWICNRNNDNYDYNSKRKELDNKDFRVNKPKMTDINYEWKEFKNFEKSEEYKNTQVATNLLSDRFDVTSSQLTNTLKSKYGFSNADCQTVLKNMANSRDVDTRVGTFDKVVRMRKRS